MSQIKKLQTAVTRRIGPFFSIINVLLVDINVFAKFYEILSLQGKPKRIRRTNGWTDNVKTV